MTTQGQSTSSTADRLGPRRRRVLYATIAAIVAVAALVLILKGPADSESAGSNPNPAPTEQNAVATPAARVATQNFSAALPSCCYPPPTTVPTDPTAPPA